MSVYFYEPFFSLNDFQRLFPESDAEDREPRHQGGRHAGRHRGGGGGGHHHPAERALSLARGFQPRMDIHESDESNLVTATIELPGLKKEDVQIDVQSNRLIVSGEQTHEKDVNEKGYVLRERSTGRFWRALPLPAGTQPTDIKASMENGVLKLTFPKSSPEQAPQRITID